MARDNIFDSIKAATELSIETLASLEQSGFAVIDGPVSSGELPELGKVYDSIISSASANDIHIGSTTTRVNDLVNGAPPVDCLYLHKPLLKVCSHVIGEPFKLSSMHARTVHANAPAQLLHRDFKRGEAPFPLLGFILMVDEFRIDNGATRFVPGSHTWSASPDDLAQEALSAHEARAQAACGKAGSMLIFNGSVWHGHLANLTQAPRRSIQGAFIPRKARSATNFVSRMSADTLARQTPLSRYLLAM